MSIADDEGGRSRADQDPILMDLLRGVWDGPRLALDDGWSFLEMVQLRFRDDHDMLVGLGVNDTIAALEGFRDFVHQLHEGEAFGEELEPDIQVRPISHGSVVIEFVVLMFTTDPIGATTATTGAVGLIGGAIAAATKSSRAEVVEVRDLPNGRVRLTFQDDTLVETTEAAWQALNRRPKRTKKALYKLTQALDHKASSVEVRSSADAFRVGSQPPVVIATGEDREALLPAPPETVTVREFETEGQVTRIDYNDATQWRIATPSGSRSATMADLDYLDKIDKGEAPKKTDIFWFEIRETSEVVKDRTKTAWTILKVLSQRKRSGDDPGNAGSP